MPVAVVDRPLTLHPCKKSVPAAQCLRFRPQHTSGTGPWGNAQCRNCFLWNKNLRQQASRVPAAAGGKRRRTITGGGATQECEAEQREAEQREEEEAEFDGELAKLNQNDEMRESNIVASAALPGLLDLSGPAPPALRGGRQPRRPG